MWKKRGNANTLEEYLTSTSGCSLEELISPKHVDANTIENLPQAADAIRELTNPDSTTPIYIVGDYDADGITSTAMLKMLLSYFWLEATTIIPRRFTDGYGLSQELIKEIKNSIIITVDNGIVAREAVAFAKKNDNTVIILDHHLPEGELPDANVVVDTHIHPENNGFVDYCAAGLVLKLAELLIGNSTGAEAAKLMVNLKVLACIGTIADVMPLIGDNRYIVKEGLKLINTPTSFAQLTAGIRSLLNIKQETCTEETIQFKIAPILNAPGRLYDKGSTSALKAILCNNKDDAANYVQKMMQINEDRKKITKEWEEKCSAIVDSSANIIVLLLNELPEGLAGLLAGKLSEKYQKVTFIFTNSKEGGIVKGSGRSYGDFDISGLLEEIKPLTVKAGGHAGAAGLSVKAEMFPSMEAKMKEYMATHWTPQEIATYYDLELKEEDVKNTLATLKKYAPYGEHLAYPTFLISPFFAVPKRGANYYAKMGKEETHLKLFGQYVDAVGFSKADEYDDFGCPDKMSLIATINENVFMGKATAQIQIIEIGELF